MTTSATSPTSRTRPAADPHQRVLVVEPDRAHAASLELLLERQGLAVAVVDRGAAAMQAIETGPEPSAILLELSLPDIDGVELCSMLRVWARCPIVVVTSVDDDARLVAALDSGADDFLVRPYNTAVLEARLRVALRHSAVLAATVGEEQLECGDVRLDVGAHAVRLGDQQMDLQPRQFTLLVTLLRNADRMVPYAQLIRVLWGEHAGVADIDRLRAAVSVLRKSLGSGPLRPTIETEPSLGYRLVSPR